MESANLNAETMLAMKKGSEALKGIHTSLYVTVTVTAIQSYRYLQTDTFSSNVDKVDQTMDSIREQMDLTNEISDAISNPVGMGNQVDEVCLTSHFHSAQSYFTFSPCIYVPCLTLFVG